MAYLQGQHRVVFRVTSRGTDAPPAMPEHCTLTYSQRVLTRGRGPEGAYVDLEVRTFLPAAIGTHAPYPVTAGSLPDSVRPYLERSDSREDRTAVAQLLDRIRETSRPVYQDQMVEAVLRWAASYVEYDSAATTDQSPRAVIERRSATCAGYAELTVALLRQAGIPARRMGCVIPPDCGWGQLGRGGRHAFIEAYDSDVGWLPSDPLRSFHFVDPFHLLTRIDGRGASLGYETLDFQLLEDTHSTQVAAMTREPDQVRWSAVLRDAGSDTSVWVPYTFRHRRRDGFFVSVSPLGDQVSSSRDGTRDFRWVWGDREQFDAAGKRRFVEARIPWCPPRMVERESRQGHYRFFPDGRREFRHESGTLEIRYPDGMREFHAAAGDGFVTITRPDGAEETRFANGTRQARAADGSEQVSFPNGDSKRTEPDGTVRYFFSNGDQQTTYPDGRQLYEWANGARQIRAPGSDLSVERRTE